MPIQPTNREAKRLLYECAKYTHRLLMNNNRFPSKNRSTTVDHSQRVRDETRDADDEDAPAQAAVQLVVALPQC